MQKSRKSITDLILHLHPQTVPRETLRVTLSWGLGGMAVVLVCLQFLTGVLMLLVYQPSVVKAYESILALTRDVPFGLWVRNIHHWSANLLVGVVLLHLLRVVLTGAFGPDRRLNWIIGLCLLFLLLSANFTGYLLPWDQLGYWAVTICTSMLGYIPICGAWLQDLLRGGAEIGAPTLENFFVLHVAFIPGSLLLLMFWHFWLVRRAGGLVRIDRDKGSRVERLPAVPGLIIREAAFGLVLVALVLLLAIAWDAPLLAQANPGMSPNPAKAPWYFQGFQELLMHLHPMFAAFVWPLLAGAALLLVPFWRESSLPAGIWFGSQRGRHLAGWTTLASALATVLCILADNWLAGSGATVGMKTFITRGVLPTGFMVAFLAGLYRLLVMKLHYKRAEAVMAGIILVLTALTVCTMIGAWFRGPEMHLVWPWQQPRVYTP
jgi:quinol-cytochrome oxidoreductase complex cytochrome b subunit